MFGDFYLMLNSKLEIKERGSNFIKFSVKFKKSKVLFVVVFLFRVRIFEVKFKEVRWKVWVI